MPKKTTTKKLGATKVEKPKKEAKKFDYEIVITTSDVAQEFKTNDILETLKAFETPTDYFKTETVIKVTSDKKTVEKMLNVAQAKRAFSGKVAIEILAKDLKTLVD